MRNILSLMIYLFCSVVLAQGEQDNTGNLLSELEELHRQGVIIQNSYNIDDINQLKFCIKEYGHLRDKAKELIARAKLVDITSNRMYFGLAANAGFSCVYCGGGPNTQKSCNQMAKDLATIKNMRK